MGVVVFVLLRQGTYGRIRFIAVSRIRFYLVFYNPQGTSFPFSEKKQRWRVLASVARTTTANVKLESTDRSTWNSMPAIATSPWLSTLIVMMLRCQDLPNSSNTLRLRSAS